LTTAHELGAALGVAVLAAVAIANGNPVSGYGNGFLVAGAIAALLAVVAVVALPALRPAPGTQASMH
jgi:sugar phosphate permease